MKELLKVIAEAKKSAVKTLSFLPPQPKKPRAKARKMMTLCDAGDAGSGFDAQFKCHRCGYVSEWMPIKTTTEGKRGKPCPVCNVEKIAK